MSDEVVVWSVGPAVEALRAAGLGEGIPVVLVGSEAEFFESLPPRKNPRLLLVDVAAGLTATAGLLAMLAGRPASWPPIVVFGEDAAVVKAIDMSPNSRLLVTPQTLVARLRVVANYWVRFNEPMTIE